MKPDASQSKSDETLVLDGLDLVLQQHGFEPYHAQPTLIGGVYSVLLWAAHPKIYYGKLEGPPELLEKMIGKVKEAIVEMEEEEQK